MSLDYSSLSTEQLLKEIQREQQLIESLYAQLFDAEERLKTTQRALDNARRRGQDYNRLLADIRAVEAKIAERELKIIDLEQRANALARQLQVLDFFDRYITAQVIESLRKSISAYRGWQSRDRRTLKSLTGRTWQRLNRLLNDLEQWRITIASLRNDIRAEEQRIEAKKEELKRRRQLNQVKIRLYNMIAPSRDTPVGMFQGFYTIDAMMKRETGEVDWNWWLTRNEILIAKYDMVAYFKGMGKWHYPEQLGLAAFESREEGITSPNALVRYQRKIKTGEPYAKNVSPEIISRAERLSVHDLILGESSIVPKQIPSPQGVRRDRMMIIVDEKVKWDEIFNELWIYRPTEEEAAKVKEETG